MLGFERLAMQLVLLRTATGVTTLHDYTRRAVTYSIGEMSALLDVIEQEAKTLHKFVGRLSAWAGEG